MKRGPAAASPIPRIRTGAVATAPATNSADARFALRLTSDRRRRTRSTSAWLGCVPAVLLLAGLALAGCGSDSTQNFATCGNGTLDTGETCDDGNVVDTDACTSACQPATCGDGVVEAGVEQCDGFLSRATTCQSLGLGGSGPPVCSAACQLDLSACGPAFTPTPIQPTATSTTIPSATSPPPPTATPNPGACGDGLLEASESCDTCPADCTPQACAPSGQNVTFEIVLASGDGAATTEARIELAYRTSVLTMPGSGSGGMLLRRVRPLQQPRPLAFAVSDSDVVLTVAINRPEGLSGPIASAQFETCRGAPAPTLADFSCVVPSCSAPLGCSCTVQVPSGTIAG